jgi:superfamily I DNA/RNA helicase
MPITPAQIAHANQVQWAAAQANQPQVRLIAGPGTGKSATIERRVAHVLNSGANPQTVFVISFTRASCRELGERVSQFCSQQPCAAVVGGVRVSTMHALALRILRSAAVLQTLYPADPQVLDDWENEFVYDSELANTLGVPPGRAAEIRRAHDAQWQTLNPQLIGQAAITQAEAQGFTAFHASRRNLYSCVLPGEMVYECVTRLQQGAIAFNQLPVISHLIVDEYQDLNACDQEFVRLLTAGGATLFVAGDDDQSIYSFRHADPSGIVNFPIVFPTAAQHALVDCFRCTPSVLNPALTLIAHNPGRLQKQLQSVYLHSAPPVAGSLRVWSFPSAQQEARGIAESCRALIANGMNGQENEIVVLISNRRVQLDLISQELANLGLPFDTPRGDAARDILAVRAAYSLLRIVRDFTNGEPDYVAFRDLISVLHGVGSTTGRQIGDLCITNLQNFRDLFVGQHSPPWLVGRPAAAVGRVRSAVQSIVGWALLDTLGMRGVDIRNILQQHIFNGSNQLNTLLADWDGLIAALPGGMTLEETLEFLGALEESDQRAILDAVNARLATQQPAIEPQPRRIRILTMHGAKGLSGRVVFIPSLEQGIMPSFRAIQATGLLNEQRRLFYVSLTRARAACIVSHAALHRGASAFVLQQKPQVRLTRSQFLNEMGTGSQNRAGGLTVAEAAQITSDFVNL